MNIKTTIETITPSWAEQRLKELEKAQEDKEFTQRNPRLRAIQQYAQDMKAGRWLLTHQGIAFNDKNQLIDGQNRLWAVVKSQCEVQMLVTRGVPHNGEVTALDVIDGGAVRSLAQSFQISHGYGSNAGELAVIVRQVLRMIQTSRGTEKGVPTSTATALFVMELGFKAAYERLATIIPLRKSRRGPVIAPLSWYWIKFPEKAESFARDYATLEELKAGSPALALFRWFERTSEVRRRWKSESDKQSVTAAAIQAYHAGELVKALVPSPKVALPWLVKLNEPLASRISKRALIA